MSCSCILCRRTGIRLGLLLLDNTASNLLNPDVLGSVLTAAKKTPKLPPLFMGLWPRRAVIVFVILKNWLVIVWEMGQVGWTTRLLEDKLGLSLSYFGTADGFKINLPPCTTYFPEDTVKTVASSYCKEEKYIFCRTVNHPLVSAKQHFVC